jgi:hypothetical protein
VTEKGVEIDKVRVFDEEGSTWNMENTLPRLSRAELEDIIFRFINPFNTLQRSRGLA